MPSSSASPFPDPVVAWSGGADRPDLPLVVLLHGRGADERSILGLADHLPDHLSAASYAAVRAPIGEGGGYAWFANRGIGRPLPESLAATTVWFRAWLDGVAPQGRPVVLVGFSGGAAFAGGVLLDDPSRLAGTAVLHGTLPFEDAGVDVSAGRLGGSSVFLTHGDADTVIPLELQARTWSWLHDESGATLTSRRDPGGHALSAETVAELSDWIAARVGAEA